MRVVVVQLSAGPDVSANTEQAVAGIASAAQQRSGADLVVLPEATMRDLGPAGTDIAHDAQDLDGPFVAALAAEARQHRLTVIAGMFEKAPDGRAFNTLVAISPTGDLVATYRKTHLYDAFGYRESDRIAPGEPTAVVLPVDDHQVGLMTCYDLRFPEQARALVDAGATTIALPAAWVRGALKEDHWRTLVRARAIENTVFVVAAGQCGSGYSARSLIVDPHGIVMAEAHESADVIDAEMSTKRLAEVRAANPSLQHRRWQVTPRA